MTCPACQAALPDDATFCGHCGSALRSERSCARCGKANTPEMRFCLGCGNPLSPTAPVLAPRAYTPRHLAEKILTSRPALEGERKHVTVLFADVKGSMELAEQVDPEEWHKILDRFFAILAEGVHRFEGTVNQYTGDGIMALFGAPIAHEDHGQRACYAALHLRAELRRYTDELRRTKGLNFAVRMGLNSGEVVVGRIGDDLRMDYTAQGHTVGLAARMEQLAAPDRVNLTEHTAALIAGYFQLRDLGWFAIKGVREPVRVYELEGVGALRTRLDVSRARGFSRFVGRDDEMAALEAALVRGLAGQGEVVGVVADPGVGKSRLCYEFVQRCRARGIAVYEGHGVAHGKMIPFLPVLETLRGYFGIGEQDAVRATREKIAGRLLLLDREFEDALPGVFEFLGVPDPERPVPRMDPEARQRQLFGVLKRLIHASNRREPAVVLFEDLHWFDGGSEAFLANHVEALLGAQGLLLLNFRPEYHASWMQRSYYQQLPIVPLGPEAIAALLTDLLGTDASLAGLAERIRERTGGNPFFIEEVVQALVEDGHLVGTRGVYRLARPVESLAIPVSVQAVLAARIDRLAEREKRVLQTAAVIGKEFTEPVLGAITNLHEAELEAALRALTGAEFVYETALYPEAEYAFKHPLTQEVAYRSQLAERRAGVHAAVAAAIEATSAGRLEERAALVAHHHEAAGASLEGARWSARAAEWATARDPAEAFRHWRRVRTLLDAAPPSADVDALRLAACSSILYLGLRVGLSLAEAAQIFAEGEALAESAADLRALAFLHYAYSLVVGYGGVLGEALPHATEAARLAEATDDLALRLAVRDRQVQLLMGTGRLTDALSLADSSIALAEGSGAPGEATGGLRLSLLAYRALTLVYTGRLAEAGRAVDTALDFAREVADANARVTAHSSAVAHATATDDTGRALEHGRRAAELGERAGSAWSRMHGYRTLGLAYLAARDWSGAVDALTTALAVARESRVGRSFEAATLAFLAEACLGSKDLGPAQAYADEADEARDHTPAFFRVAVLLARARVLLAGASLDARAAVEAMLAEAEERIHRSGAVLFQPRIHEQRAALARLTGDEHAWEQALREAHRLFTEMGATARAAQVARELGSSVESTCGISSTSRT